MVNGKEISGTHRTDHHKDSLALGVSMQALRIRLKDLIDVVPEAG